MTENRDSSETCTMDNHPPLDQEDTIGTDTDANHPPLSQKDQANETEDNNSNQGDYNKETRSTDQEGNDTKSGMTHSEQQVLQLIAESNKQLSELVRRNEEKREAVDELTERIQKLESENRALQEQNSKLIEENLYLTMRSQKENGSINFSGTRSKSLTRLKSLFMSTFGSETPHAPSPLKD